MGIRDWPSDDQNLFGDHADPDIHVNRLSETGTKNRTKQYNHDGYLKIEFSYERPDAIYEFTRINWWVERSNGLLISFGAEEKFDRLLIPWHNIRNFYVRVNTEANRGV